MTSDDQEQEPLQTEMTVLAPRAASAFRSANQRSMLLALMVQERSASELARLLERSLSLIHHHLQRLISFELIKVTREAGRRGAPIRYYRAVAQSFFLPIELAGSDLDRELRLELLNAIEICRRRSCPGVRFHYDGSSIRMSLVRTTTRRQDSAVYWAELCLTDADAADFAKDLQLLIDDYGRRSSPRHPKRLVHAAIVRK